MANTESARIQNLLDSISQEAQAFSKDRSTRASYEIGLLRSLVRESQVQPLEQAAAKVLRRPAI